MIRKLVIPAILLLLVAFTYIITRAEPAPQGTMIATLDGQQLYLSQLKGKPVLVTFWASDCGICLKEIPDLVALHQDQASGNSPLEIIAVAMYYDPPIRVKRLAEQLQLPYTIGLDPQGKLAHAFGDVALTPQHFLISPEGNIIDRTLGRLDIPRMQAKLQPYL